MSLRKWKIENGEWKMVFGGGFRVIWRLWFYREELLDCYIGLNTSRDRTTCSGRRFCLGRKRL